MTPIITVGNKKGGVGKTTAVFNLAGSLAAEGMSVLAIDGDFQANLTSAFWGTRATYALDPATTVAAIAEDGPLPYPADLIRETAVPGVHLIPGSLAAERLDLADPESLDPSRQTRMRDFLAEVSGYDAVLIDTHPGGNYLAWQALIASTHVLIPVVPERFGSLGIGPMLKLIARAKGLNPELALAGVLLNMVKRRSVHRAFEEALREEYGGDVFDATLPDLGAFPDALEKYVPVCLFKPKGNAAQRMRAFTRELLAKLAGERVEEVVDAQA